MWPAPAGASFHFPIVVEDDEAPGDAPGASMAPAAPAATATALTALPLDLLERWLADFECHEAWLGSRDPMRHGCFLIRLMAELRAMAAIPAACEVLVTCQRLNREPPSSAAQRVLPAIAGRAQVRLWITVSMLYTGECEVGWGHVATRGGQDWPVMAASARLEPRKVFDLICAAARSAHGLCGQTVPSCCADGAALRDALAMRLRQHLLRSPGLALSICTQFPLVRRFCALQPSLEQREANRRASAQQLHADSARPGDYRVPPEVVRVLQSNPRWWTGLSRTDRRMRIAHGLGFSPSALAALITHSGRLTLHGRQMACPHLVDPATPEQLREVKDQTASEGACVRALFARRMSLAQALAGGLIRMRGLRSSAWRDEDPPPPVPGDQG